MPELSRRSARLRELSNRTGGRYIKHCKPNCNYCVSRCDPRNPNAFAALVACPYSLPRPDCIRVRLTLTTRLDGLWALQCDCAIRFTTGWERHHENTLPKIPVVRSAMDITFGHGAGQKMLTGIADLGLLASPHAVKSCVQYHHAVEWINRSIK
jgi:hypothetical protein